MNAKRNTTVPANRTFGSACLATCQKLIAGIQHAKEAILAEFRETLKTQEHLLRLAVNEAEALAWQTDFPHLVFPALAMEKVRAVAAWQARQRSIPATRSLCVRAA
jgi:hypothetical protein